MISVLNIKSGYKNKTVIDDISFDAKNGEKICIVGPNGCGKSTLLKTIVGLIDYKGNIYLDNLNIRQLKHKKIANKISMMNQISTIYFSYTVFETVMLGRYAKIKSSIFETANKIDVDFVNSCLESVGIIDLKDRFITDLSGGELQRVFLARAFAQEPDIILLDEPTNHLDIKHQIELINYIENWVKEKNTICIAVLHDLNLALQFADKILVLKEGKQIDFDYKSTILENGCFDYVYDINVKNYMKKTLSLWNV